MTLVKQHPAHFLFEDVWSAFPAQWNKDAQHHGFNPPAVNIHETSDGYHIELNAPGRNKEDFKVDIDNDLLTISFEKKEETQTENKDYRTIRKEFTYKNFKRSFTLDKKINTEGIQAKYENGVLKLYLPKKEEVKISPKQISIS